MSPTPLTVSQAFALALQHHQAGRLPEAEALYRQILAVQPQHAESLHHLGVIAQQSRRPEIAVGLIRGALVLDPKNSAAHYNLAEVYRTLGRFEEAIASYREALRLDPNRAEIHNNLGIALAERNEHDAAIAAYRQAVQLKPDYAQALYNLGNALRARGQLEEAVAAYRRALAREPGYALAHNNLGNALRDRGNLDEATDAFRRALQFKPDYPLAHYNLGNVLKDRGQFEEAIAAYRDALRVEPNYPDALNNLGIALAASNQMEEAEGVYRRALQLRPDFPEARFNFASVLTERGQFDQAATEYRRAIAGKPDYAVAHFGLGMALAELGHFAEAATAYRRALELKPDSPAACNGLGSALAELGSLDEAIASFRRALELRPEFPEALVNLGLTLGRQGLLDEAVAAYQRALEIKPDGPYAYNNLGNAFKDQGRLDEAITAYRRALNLAPEISSVRSNLIYALHFHAHHDAVAIAEEQRQWNQRVAASLPPLAVSYSNDRDPERLLRVGYISPNFRDHVVGRNVLPLFEHHDRTRFHVLCYSADGHSDWMTERFRKLSGTWREVKGLADDRLARLIRDDAVDILVDLAQHLAGNCLPVFARRPAPVQVNFAGYPESAGVDAIPYRISDRYLEAEIGKPAEQVFLLDSFWCYDPCGTDAKVNGLPAAESGRVTFGSLNNFCKVNEPLLRLWARVLDGVKDSRLVLLSASGSHRQRTLEVFAQAGIELQRVEFVEQRPRPAYLELYHRLDIVLDSFPYNGHTTSLDALWMGVPVISLAGRHPVSRAGLSQLSNLDLPELVAFSEDEYVAIAIRLAGNLSLLSELRVALRDRIQASSLTNARRFARQIETALRMMWRGWCEGQGIS